jgi:hypothetical protein
VQANYRRDGRAERVDQPPDGPVDFTPGSRSAIGSPETLVTNRG